MTGLEVLYPTRAAKASGDLQGSGEAGAPAAAQGCCQVPALKSQAPGSDAQQKYVKQLCLLSQGYGVGLGQPDNRPDTGGWEAGLS